jgi:formylglycine-generating enzyme required for sulfatase activity
MDKFEVTVGRFREFVDAYPSSKPAAGEGVHPHVGGTGWSTTWDAELPGTRQELIDGVTGSECNTPRVVTFTAEPSANESRAMNCVTWYEAFAYCAWSGGRLPSLAEHSLASTGGTEQRVYPWSSPADSTTVDATYATYGNDTCPSNSTDNAPCISPVGSTPLGVGRWGHMDLSGNVAEFVFDVDVTLPVPCNNCIATDVDMSARVLMGGYYNSSSTELRNANTRYASARSKIAGIRCVYP